MKFKNWIIKRREEKNKKQRFEELTEEETQTLYSTEKKSYLEIAKKQVGYRGKINAYKDFPINETEKKEIDTETVEEKDNEIEEPDEDFTNEDLIEIKQELDNELNESEEKLDGN